MVQSLLAELCSFTFEKADFLSFRSLSPQQLYIFNSKIRYGYVISPTVIHIDILGISRPSLNWSWFDDFGQSHLSWTFGK
jgi:hypothetical protein